MMRTDKDEIARLKLELKNVSDQLRATQKKSAPRIEPLIVQADDESKTLIAELKAENSRLSAEVAFLSSELERCRPNGY